MVGKVFEGTVQKWIERGASAGFGFVEFDHGGARTDTAYYSFEDITADNIGRRSHGAIVGNLVRFRLKKYDHRGTPRVKATEVTSVFSTDVPDPVDEHREVSVVDNIVKGFNEPIGSVFLRRESGDKLYLSVSDVAEPYKNQFQQLCVGDHVWHGVQPPIDNRPLWHATVAEFYCDAEEEALRDEVSS